MTTLPISPNLGLSRSIQESRELLSDLQRQLATGKKIETYGQAGVQRNQLLSVRSEISQISAYQKTVQQADIRLDVMLLSVERLRELTSDTKSDALEVGYQIDGNGKTAYQIEVEARFDEVIGLMNTHIGDRHLFAGRDTESNPVRPSSEILNGTGSQAGFNQIVSERRQADLGADGLGRLVFTGPEATVTGGVVATPGDIGGVATAQFTIDIGGTAHTFDVSDAGSDTLAALETAIDTAFGSDVASIVGGNQLRITATNDADAITITDVNAGAAALAGLTTGSVTNPATVTSFAEDVAGSPFGFKLASVSTTSAGIDITGPAGAPPQIDFDFNATGVSDGDTVRVTYNLPDGTQHDMTLTARSTGPVDPGEFLIDTSRSVTAGNFETALTTAVQTEAQRSLAAASTFAASDNFFNFDAANPPQRVNGPPFNTATGLVNATTANTVFWYQGEDSATPARSSITAKVDDTIVAGYGARANEQAMRTVIQTFAAIASETFTAGDANASDRYFEIKQRAHNSLAFNNGSQSLDDVLAELTAAKTTIGRAGERHKAGENVLTAFVEREEEADAYEVSAAILALQTRVEASLQVTASLSRLSLVNFL